VLGTGMSEESIHSYQRIMFLKAAPRADRATNGPADPPTSGGAQFRSARDMGLAPHADPMQIAAPTDPQATQVEKILRFVVTR